MRLSYDGQEASLVVRLVTYRYGRGGILITTNKSVRDWTELLAGDEVLMAAILDCLLHRAHVLNIKGRMPTAVRSVNNTLTLTRRAPWSRTVADDNRRGPGG